MRLIIASLVTIAAVALAGCPNPNAIGVQDMGTIVATTVDGTSGQPIANVIVSAGSNFTCTTASNGVCTLPQVPVGAWTVMGNAAGLHGSATTTVTKNNTSNVTIQMNP